MGSIHRLACRDCARGPRLPWNETVAGAVITGQPTGTLTSGHWLTYTRNDGVEVMLPHPLETYTLEQEGTTWARASAERRIWIHEPVACVACGVWSSERRAQPRQALGCVAFCVAAALMYALRSIVPWWTFLVVLVPMMLVPSVLQRRRLRSPCAVCGGARVPLARVNRSAVPCQACGGTVRCTGAGVS